MKLRTLLLACACLLASCNTATPTPEPQPQPPEATVSPVPPKTVPGNTQPPAPSSTPNSLGMNIVASFDPTKQILTIYGTTPGATIVYGGRPILPPPTATETSTPLPTTTNTPLPTFTRAPLVIMPTATSVPQPVVSLETLRGKIIFKSTREGGFYPNGFQYYAMNPDGSGVQKLDYSAANPLYVSVQSREGVSPDGARVVLGERRCFSGMTCTLYILDTALDARLINSNDDISHGQWLSYRGFQAKDPVWSPASKYIAFVSNHESGDGCVRSSNIFKGTPTQKPVIKRLTDKGDFCANAAIGHPSFSPDGEHLTFWGEGSGLKQIYVLSVGGDDNFDYRESNVHIITDHQFDEWDPLWVK